MGYNTRYELTVTGEDDDFKTALSFLGTAKGVVTHNGDSGLFDGEKRYETDVDEHLLAVSARYPGILFKVSASPQSGCGDAFDLYYQAGKKAKYVAVVVIPTFNPDDLR